MHHSKDQVFTFIMMLIFLAVLFRLIITVYMTHSIFKGGANRSL